MDTNALVAGAVQGAILAIIATAIPRFTRWILLLALLVAGSIYVWFAFDAHAGNAWLGAELGALLGYGVVAFRGVRGSAWWLVCATALHPVWDVAVHYAGPGRAVAPDWYTVYCLTFDLAVAAFASLAILIGTHLSEVPIAKPAVLRPAFASACGCDSLSCTATEARAA